MKKILASLLCLLFVCTLSVNLTNAQSASCDANIPFNLELGSNNIYVLNLQKILNLDPATQIAYTGPGSPGNETTYFGNLTRAAVAKFQQKYAAEILAPAGFTAPTGMIGPFSITKLKTICAAAAFQGSTLPPVSQQTAVPVEDTSPLSSISVTAKCLSTTNLSLSIQWAGAAQNTKGYRLEVTDESDFDHGGWTKSLPANSSVTAPQTLTDLTTFGGKQGTLTFKEGNRYRTRVKNMDTNDYSRIKNFTIPICNPDLALAAASTTPNIPTPDKKIPIYSWHEPTASTNIVPFAWLMDDQLGNIAAIKAKLDAQPSGKRVLFIWNSYNSINTDPRDTCPQGTTSTTRCIWWDNGVAVTKAKLDEFFKNLKASGASVDVIVMDFEEAPNNWALPEDIYAKIEQDPRYPALRSELLSLGFPSNDTLENVRNWRSGDDYLIWNAAMLHRAAAYLNDAIFSPAQKYYPSVTMGTYGFSRMSKSHPVPDPNGHRDYKYNSGDVVGTHQSPALYASYDQLQNQSLDGTTQYNKTPFNGLRYSVNMLRASKLSSNTPLLPWVAFRSWSESFVQNNDYYQELLFHTLLTGADGLLYWNPLGAGDSANASNDKAINDSVNEFNSIAGYRSAKSLVNDLVPWGADYMLTGSKINNSLSVWRFTPDVAKNPSLSATVVQSANPVILKTKNSKITIPNASIRNAASVSSSGYWIIQNSSGSFSEERITMGLKARDFFASVSRNIAGAFAAFADLLKK